jgi:hypothetical protein
MTAEALAKGHFATFLHENGYRAVRDLGDGRYAALAPFLFTTAIITGRWGDYIGLEDRWCYHTAFDAKAALEAWDGLGEPTGWHRHPGTGRRVDEDGKAYVSL